MKCVELAPKLVSAKRSDVPNSEAKSAQAHFEGYVNDEDTRMELEMSRTGDYSEDAAYRFFYHKATFEPQVASLGSDELIHCEENNGIFSAALTAYNKHWKLRTTPDDWWFCVIKRVSLAIDQNGNKDAVRKMFVNHEGKKTLTVAVPNATIYDVDYPSFFDKMANEIARNIKVPKYVEAVTADFTTTTADTKIVSQMTVMSSVKKYFLFNMVCICGIPGVEMLGTEEDWAKLSEKLKALREILKPIEDEIGLTKEWWSHAEKVFQKLLKTYQGKPDKKWWNRILHEEGARSYGQIQGYTGWLVHFAEGTTRRVGHRNLTSGLVSVPLEISHPCGTETGTLVAGMLGFTVQEDEAGSRPSVQPYQGWSLLLPKDSPLRVKTAA